ncbi:MAG: hypothetical protein HY654_12740 [Acidobacteria bacterium]|nr:hypothetical protein [Acidobacteriota bacterium]
MKTLIALTFALLMAASVAAGQPPAAQSEFVPLSQAPAAEQLPAAPLLIAAYSFFLVAVVGYLWTIWRRLNKVDAELQALRQKTRPQH